MIFKCPGLDNLRQPKPQMIKCLNCGKEVKIWTDEFQINCPFCKKKISRKIELNCCLEWCKYAKECAGEELYNRYLKNKNQNKT
ncbi:MAG: hypothetical protein NC826_06410 [Candidatus Omnitrophica bacterium]|nr:hypothetical protein [Candidatus Omnitrophota bacterium]